MDRRVVVGGGIFAVLAVLLLGALIAQDTSPGEVEVPEPAPVEVAEPDPEAPIPRGDNGSTPPPDELHHADFPEERPPPAVVTPDDKRKMNFAVDEAMTAAREDCILPWIDEIAEPTEAEFVMDVVLWNGRIYDYSIRSLTLDLPRDVLGCIGDKVWYQEWPTWELPGELRLQRQVKYRNSAMMPQLEYPPEGEVDEEFRD